MQVVGDSAYLLFLHAAHEQRMPAQYLRVLRCIACNTTTASRRRCMAADTFKKVAGVGVSAVDERMDDVRLAWQINSASVH